MPIFSFLGYTLTQKFKKLTIDDKFINKRVRLFIHQTMCLKRVQEKKLLVPHNKVVKWLFTFKKAQK